MSADGGGDWEARWREHARAHGENPARRYRTRLVLAAVGEAGRAPRVLDLGCGPGVLAGEIAEAFPEATIVGVDRSREAVTRARALLARGRFFEADLTSEAWPLEHAELRGFADVATCCEVLEHLDDPGAALRNLRACLAPEGRLIVTVPSGPRTAFDVLIGHRRHYRADELRALLDREGFTVERVRAAGFPFFNLYKLAVLLRGRAVERDARLDPTRPGARGHALEAAYAVFEALFRANLERTPWGWQLLAVARRRAAAPGAESGR